MIAILGNTDIIGNLDYSNPQRELATEKPNGVREGHVQWRDKTNRKRAVILRGCGSQLELSY